MLEFKVILKARSGISPKFIEEIVKAVDKTNARILINSGRFQYMYDVSKIEKI